MKAWALGDMLAFVLAEASKAGATAADAVAVTGASLGVRVRLGNTEKIKRAQAKQLGLRVFLDQRSAVTSTTDCSREALRRLAADSCALARVLPPDEHAGLPDQCDVAGSIPDLSLCADAEVGVEAAVDRARAAEAAALASDPRITNSEGAEFDAATREIAYSSSRGFFGTYRTSNFSLSVVPVATRGGQMQRDYWYAASRALAALASPEVIGQTAAARALRRLGARPVATQEIPVVFEAEVGASLLRHLAAAVSGYSLYQGTSFLANKSGQQIASPLVTVVDDGTMPGALGSRPFDGEGVATRRTVIIERGVLANCLFDTYSARKMRTRTTGNAARPVGAGPHVGTNNLYLAPGSMTTGEIIRSVSRGLMVTELIGHGINPVTGDYSRGAVGLWIEGGEIAYPVEEVTVAGNLLQMYRDIEAIGAELDFRSPTVSPTVKISRMTVAGR